MMNVFYLICNGLLIMAIILNVKQMASNRIAGFPARISPAAIPSGANFKTQP